MVLNYILVGCPCLVLPLTQQKSYCANSVPELLWKYILYKYLVFWWGRFLIPFFQSKSSIFTRMFHVHTKCRIQHLKTRKDTKIIVLRKKALNFCTDWNFCTTISSTYEHDRHISQSIQTNRIFQSTSTYGLFSLSKQSSKAMESEVLESCQICPLALWPLVNLFEYKPTKWNTLLKPSDICQEFYRVNEMKWKKSSAKRHETFGGKHTCRKKTLT